MPSIDDLVARLRLDSTNFDRGLKGVDVSLGRLNKSAASSDSVISGLSRRLAALGAGTAAISFLKGAVAGASDLNETVSKSQVVFGESQKAVDAFASTAATSIGQSRQQALEAAATFGNLFVGLGVGQDQAARFSVELTKLASDFASFHNANPEDVVQALGAAFRGEFDSVQRFVPTINAAAVEQKGLQLGLARTSKELDAQDKLMATYTLLTEGAGAAAGDFERTSDGLANQQRILAANLDDTTASLGERLTPVVGEFITFLNEQAIPTIADVTTRIESMFGAGKPGLNNLEKGADVLAEWFKELGDNDRSLTLSDEAWRGLAESWASAEEDDRKLIAARQDETKANAAAAQAAIGLSAATGRNAADDEDAAKAAEKLTRAKEDLAKAHRNVEDAVFDLADAEDDLREAEFRQGVGSEAADKARREVEKRRNAVADAQAAVARDARDLAEANKAAAEAIATGLEKVATSVDNVAKAIPAAVAATSTPATFGPDVPAVGAGGLAPAIAAGGLAPGAVGEGGLNAGAVGAGGLQGGGNTIIVNTTGDGAAIARDVNRELDWLTRAGRAS